MNAKYPLKLYILTAVIVFVSINANVFQCLYEVIEEYIPSIGFEDEVSLYDKRYGILKALLPPHELVGYLTDEDYNPRVFNLTQYAMSPFLLTYSIKPLCHHQFYRLCQVGSADSICQRQRFCAD